MIDRGGLAAALVGLCALAWGLVPDAGVDSRVVQIVDAPRSGWYEADDLGEAARKAGVEPPMLASGAIEDGATVRMVSGWALPTVEIGSTRIFGGRVSLNRGSVAELESLPGVGPSLAARIVAGRPYGGVGELDAVRGIGPKKLSALIPLVEP